jgi:hypothetical protein
MVEVEETVEVEAEPSPVAEAVEELLEVEAAYKKNAAPKRRSAWKKVKSLIANKLKKKKNFSE